MKTIIRWVWFACFFGNYEWYRKLYGGKWVFVNVEEPCYSAMWLKIPDDATEEYREYNWRGTPIFKNYV